MKRPTFALLLAVFFRYWHHHSDGPRPRETTAGFLVRSQGRAIRDHEGSRGAIRDLV